MGHPFLNGPIRLGRRSGKRPEYTPPTPVQMIRACRRLERKMAHRVRVRNRTEEPEEVKEKELSPWESRFVCDIALHHEKLKEPKVLAKVREIYYKRVLLFSDLEWEEFNQ